MAEYLFLGEDWPALLGVILNASDQVDAPDGPLQLSPEEEARLIVWMTVEDIAPQPHGRGAAVAMPDRDTALTLALAEDIFRLWPDQSAAFLAQRRSQMLVRSQGRVNARADRGPTALRRALRPGDLSVAEVTQPYGAFFAVEEYTLTHAQFDGTRSAPLNRAVFISGDAVVVLPYDPVRDRVLLVEQFRMGPFARGDAQPWSLEAVAGRIDPGETPADSARREAEEEAGLHLSDLIALPGTYPSPGAVAEYLYNYIAVTDLPDTLGRSGGLESEGEDLRLHLISFDALMSLIDTGEVNNGPLIVIALLLERRRAELRRAI